VAVSTQNLWHILVMIVITDTARCLGITGGDQKMLEMEDYEDRHMTAEDIARTRQHKDKRSEAVRE